MARWPWYVLVFAVYPLFYIAAANPGQVEASAVVTVAAVAALAAVATIGLMRLPLPSWQAAGLGAAWLIVLFFAYGPVNES